MAYRSRVRDKKVKLVFFSLDAAGFFLPRHHQIRRIRVRKLSINVHVHTAKRVQKALRHTRTALWSGTNKNRDVSTGPLARPFARSLALLIPSLAPDCSLRSRPPLRSLVRSLAHFAYSLGKGIFNVSK